MDFYSVLVSEWQTTAAWTGLTLEEYKASLLATQRITLILTMEHLYLSVMILVKTNRPCLRTGRHNNI
jgi:hypothetical protein